MSKYAETLTELTDQEHLVAALTTMGFTPRVCVKPEHLEGYHGDKRPEVAEVIIPRRQVGGASNDIGFLKDASGRYQATISEYDSHRYGKPWMGRLTQEYGAAKQMAMAAEKGYTFAGREVIKTETGTKIQLRFTTR